MRLRVFLLSLLLAFCWPASATTYYISDSRGDDSHNGLTGKTAWKTLSRVNAARLHPGDRVLLHRGDTWREVLRPRSSGTAEAAIAFGAYGIGAAPILSGRDANIDNNGQSYITYENLDLRDAQQGLRLYLRDGIMRGVAFRHNRVATSAKRPGGMVSAGVYANAMRGKMENILVIDNTFIPFPDGLEHWGVYFVAGVHEFEIRDNRFAPAGEDAITVWHASNGLIANNIGGGNGENTIDVKDSTDVTIHNNRGDGDNEYCIVVHSVDGRTSGILVGDNQCRKAGRGGVLSAGIALLRTRNCNVLHNRVENAFGASILVLDDSPDGGNRVEHNTLVGTGHSMNPIVLQNSPGSRIFDNQVVRPEQGPEAF